ncbi:MAG: 4Fe-4S binding protein [Desulfobacterales bacterium]|nr:4Fe-4S binding protein [Desulfobacterales bacterium]
MGETILSEEIRNIAESSLIDVVGFADASEFSNYKLIQSKRRNPKLTLPQAKSIVVAGIYIGGITMPEWDDPWYGRTSRLYLSGFFLDVVKPLTPIAEYLMGKGYKAHICDGSMDEGSILPLKLAAVRAGLGWQGKHSLLISKKYGTFLALGGIITDAELEHTGKREPNRCHKCTECQKACPVDALHDPYILNREKCISSLLAQESLPKEIVTAMENRIEDCEICQYACPWNKKHLENPLKTKMTDFFQNKINQFRETFYLQNLRKLSENDYKVIFDKLNIDIPYHIFKRNIVLALENAKRA